jgi:hypothetical protein
VWATLKQRSTIAALIVSLLAAGAMCLSPLLGVPGIESALVFGLLLPPLCGAIGARVVDRLRKRDGKLEASEILADAIFGALSVFAIPMIVLSLDLLRTPVCAPIEGALFFVLGPGIGSVLAASVGAAIAIVIPRIRPATAIAVVVPFLAIGFALYGFYATPAIFSYGHFFGYFPGTLYDPDIELTLTYATFRAISIAWTLGVWAAITALWDPDVKRVGFRVPLRRWRIALGALLLIASATVASIFDQELGHESTVASIREELGGSLRSRRCTILFPREMPRRDAERLGRDCDFRIHQAETTIGVRQRARVTAFFFRSADEKRALMGASNTYIAKPWRNEVYLQVEEWPHAVLFHELTHVVAGNAGRGPFRIAGSFGGLIPSPAIIEGLAVAVAWEPREGLTPHQWARAMLDEDLAPPLESVSGLNFLLQPASRAYTATGSFVRWIYETRGADVLRRLYRTGDFEAALGMPLPRAEREWHRFLRRDVELPDEARALAQQRFSRPAIFAQICPHRVANLGADLAQDLAAGDDRAAVRNCRSILDLDEGHAYTRAVLVGALARLGRNSQAERELQRLIGPPSAALPLIAMARKDLADASWTRGRRAEAERIYRELAGEPMTDEDARQIDVRLLAIEMRGDGELALRGLLAPRRDETNDAAVMMEHVAALARARSDGLAAYLEGRQLLFRQRFDLALPRIVESRRLGLPTDRLNVEARRMEAIARFGTRDLDGSSAIWREIARDEGSDAGETLEANDWLARVRYARRRR